MNLHYFSVILITLSIVTFHLLQKSIPLEANAAISLIATYITALISSVVIYFVSPNKKDYSKSFKDINWASCAVGVAIVGSEIGVLLAYRSGWNLGYLGLLINSTSSIALVILGRMLYKQKMSSINLVGIAVCIIGIILVKYQ